MEQHKRLGMLAALGGASSFGITIVLARVAYDGGANIGAVIAFRVIFAAAILAIILRATGQNFRVPGPIRGGLVRVALGTFGITLGYLGSIQFIPVSLATVIFYTYPLMVAGSAPWMARERPSRMQIAAFFLAFAGLVLAFGPTFEGLDWRGIAMAFFAASAAAYLFNASPRVVAACGVFSVGLYVNLVAIGLTLALLLIVGGADSPDTTTGWAGLGGVGLFYILGMVLMFTALKAGGPAQTALLFNIEPLVAIAGAALLLGERLMPLQLGGVALVIGALVLTSLRRVRHRKAA